VRVRGLNPASEAFGRPAHEGEAVTPREEEAIGHGLAPILLLGVLAAQEDVDPHAFLTEEEYVLLSQLFFLFSRSSSRSCHRCDVSED
jgi:hypothetical protein